jgi:hypothetical protein
MTIAVSVVREQRFSAQTLVVRGQDNARKSATAYISIRYQTLQKLKRIRTGIGEKIEIEKCD